MLAPRSSRQARQSSRLLIFAFSVVLLVTVTWVDYVTGYELGLFAAYLGPIALAAWYGGRSEGVLLAIASAVCWYLVDRLGGHPYSKAYLIYWETGMRFVSFVTTALMLAKVREGQRRQAALLRAVSHDLRHPLSVIAGQAGILSRRAGDPYLVPKAAAAILRAARGMNATIEDLLDGARSAQGKLTLALEPIDLQSWLPSVVAAMKDSLDATRLEVAPPRPEPLAVLADAARLERILVNLVSNALKYSPPESLVRVSASSDGGRWTTISVSDAGAGLSVDDFHHLFEPFHRGTAASGRAGVGLGLFSVAALVEAHGGRIRVQNRPGAGATFLVDLPAIAQGH